MTEQPKPYIEREPEAFGDFQPASERCFWAMATTWWTTDGNHLSAKHGSGLPCDPRGSVLFEGEPEKMMDGAFRARDRYGKHGLRAFMAAYHGVIVIGRDGVPVPWSVETWDEVNRLLDAFDIVEVARAAGAEKRKDDGESGPTVH